MTQQLSRDELIEWLEGGDSPSLMKTLGIRVESYDPEAVTVVLDVDERLYQPARIVHGGVYVVMAESAASIAACLRVNVLEVAVMGMEINANHLRPIRSGILRATATCWHQGSTTHVYQIDIQDGEGHRVCISRCTIAVRPHRSPLVSLPGNKPDPLNE